MVNKISKESIKLLIDEYHNRNKSHYIQRNLFDYSSLSDNLIILNNNIDTLSFLESQGCRNFYRYYFFINPSGSKVDRNFPDDLVVISEYIYTGQPSSTVEMHHKNLGFQRYAILRKMSIVKNTLNLDIDSKLQNSSIDDFRYIQKNLNLEFDYITERIPKNNEIKEAIISKKIFKLVSNDQIQGFIWIDRKRAICELKYIFVDRRYRGQGVGRKLMNGLIFESRNAKKIQLWVLDNNSKAINLYANFGFNFENLKLSVYLG